MLSCYMVVVSCIKRSHICIKIQNQSWTYALVSNHARTLTTEVCRIFHPKLFEQVLDDGSTRGFNNIFLL